MLPFLQFTLAITIIIFVAKIGGYLSYKAGQPTVVGEVLAGLILGPSVINLFHLPMFTDPNLEESIIHLAELGVLLLMFIAGLELHVDELAKAGKIAAWAGVLGFSFPLITGYGIGILLDYPVEQALFLGLLLAPTSISISAQVLMELKVLRSKVGMGLLGGAVIDDVLVVLGLSLYLALMGGNISSGIADVGIILLEMILFLALAIAFGLWILPKLIVVAEKAPVSQGVVSFAFVILLFYSWSAEALGHMATIIGAFLAGLFFARSSLTQRFRDGFSAIAYGFFVPIFFISIGLNANLRLFNKESLWLLIALVVGAILSKVLGSGLGGLMGGLSSREAIQLGTGMIPRGEVVLIVATVGITEGLIENDVFSVAIVLVVVVTLLTPPLLRSLFADAKSSKTEVENPS